MSVFIWLNLVAIGALGLLAVVSPRMFSLVAGRRVIREDMHQIVPLLDKDFNVDHRPLPHSRPGGEDSRLETGSAADLDRSWRESLSMLLREPVFAWLVRTTRRRILEAVESASRSI